MKQFTFIFIFILFRSFCFGQADFTTISKLDTTESFTNLKDSLVKNEIAIFNFKAASVSKNNSIGLSSLIEIPLSHCDNKTINFSKGSTFIHLYFSQDNLKVDESGIKKLDSIFFVTHSHFWVRFPKSAYDGLVDLNSCNNTKGKKETAYNNQFYRAFQSKDRTRFYIYMIAGRYKERYEVIWVVKKGKYYTRTIAPIQD